MAFKFQINNDLKFNHRLDLLKKADENRPEIHRQTITGQALVKLTDDVTKIEGIGLEQEGTMADLASRKLRRDGTVIIDFGRHVVGRFKIHIEHTGSPMDAPLAVKFRFAEMPNELAHQASEYDGWLSKAWIQEETLHLDSLPVDLELPRRYSFRYAEIDVIDSSPKWQAVFSNPTAVAQSAVTTPTVAAPKLDDPVLQRIYQVGLNTLHDCMQDVFEDGPKRDRRLWLGDLRLQALANYATYDNRALVKRCLYLFGAMTTTDGRISANVFTNQDYIPDDTFMYDYSLFFISTLDDLEKQGEDREILEDLYPIAKKQWAYTQRYIAADGRVKADEDYPVFVDWSNEFDKTACGQAITIYALRQLIDLAKRMGDAEVTKYQEQLAKLEDYAKGLFDAKRGFFVSGPDREVNIASQVWMVLAHVLDDDANQALMKKTVEQLFPVRGIATPYMYHHVTEALFEAGLHDEAIKLMKTYWGKMCQLGADTYWEAFEPEKPAFSPYGSPIVNSYCHAWSCTPVYLLKKYGQH